MRFPILSIKVAEEQDLVAARHRTRHVASLLGFDAQDQTRLATAVSEIGRNAYRYARGGRIEFALEGAAQHQSLEIRVIDKGPGIADVDAILQGRYRSSTGMGVGIQGTRRLVDQLRIETGAKGTNVILKKALPKRAPVFNTASIGELANSLAASTPANAFDELQTQNHELLRVLEELRLRQSELARLNQELEDTNRGVLALYAELDQNAERLKQANQVKSTFLSHMSHEFRTPLNSIMALAGILLQHMDGPLNSEQEKQVTFIQKAAHELTEMVNDLLDLAKVEAGKIEVHAAELRVSTLFGALRGMLRPLLFDRPVQLSFDYSEDFNLYTDEAKVSQILRNFVSNAIKFTEQGEIRVSADAEEGGLAVRFSVTDTGIGIAPEDQERIFQQFTQVDNPRQRNVKGTGLGLPLSKKLAELLGGRIELVSKHGAGSTFSLVVPLRYGEHAVMEKPLLPVREKATRQILVFPGNSDRHDAYRSLLVEAGIGEAVFVNEQTAERTLASFTPDGAIVHVTGHGDSEWRVLRLLFERNVPAVAIARIADEQQVLDSGASFEPEPLNVQRLVHRLLSRLDAGRRRILVIDDDDVARYLVNRQLSDLPVQVIEAHNATEGLERARHDRPHAIILDLMMPEVSGFETLDDLKTDTRTRDIPVVIHTSMTLTQRDWHLLSEKSVAIVDKNHTESNRLKEVIAGLVEPVTR